MLYKQAEKVVFQSVLLNECILLSLVIDMHYNISVIDSVSSEMTLYSFTVAATRLLEGN